MTNVRMETESQKVETRQKLEEIHSESKFQWCEEKIQECIVFVDGLGREGK